MRNHPHITDSQYGTSNAQVRWLSSNLWDSRMMKLIYAALLALGLSFSLFPITALAGYAEGYAAYKKQDFATAMREFEPLASQGHAQSQFGIGLMYQNGEGVAKNGTEAVKWFRLAANQGNATFQWYLGRAYDKGQGVAQDYKEAVKWYRLAANQGYSSAQNDLGVMYAKGQGVAQDDKEAVKWYRLAANQGNADSKTNLAYYEGRKKEQIADSKRKAEEAARMEEEVKRKAEEAALMEEEVKRKAEEAVRIEAEAKRTEEEARRKAEEAARIEEEAKRKAEEVKRLEDQARRKAERNVRIVSWVAAVIGVLGVIAFFMRKRKQAVTSSKSSGKVKTGSICRECGKEISPESKFCPHCGATTAASKTERGVDHSRSRLPMKNCLKCGYQRLPTDIGPDSACPKCGAIYVKVEVALAEKLRQQAETQKTMGPVHESSADTHSASQEVPKPVSASVLGSKGINEKFCSDCAAVINAKAEICPKCGVRQMPKPDSDSGKIDSVAHSESSPDVPVVKKKSLGLLKILAIIAGIGIVSSIVLPGGRSRTPVSQSEPQPSADDVCRDKGDNVAKVYFENLPAMIQNNITASDMMNEACVIKTQGTECQKLCQDGFKYQAQQFLKN